MWELLINYEPVLNPTGITFDIIASPSETLTECLRLAIDIVFQSPDELDFNSIECVWEATEEN